ncbi:MAG: hypothetical protein JWP92_2218 [Caulobacter sp.]|nr:hypothetical protein [Caulobacter sp.]
MSLSVVDRPSSAPAASGLDLASIGLSSLCLIHCLALPALAAVLPLVAVWARAEWVHGLFVACAAPITGLALWRAHRAHPSPPALLILAGLGLAALLLGAVGWPRPAWETPVTVVGSLALATAHLWNWRRAHRRAH